MDDDGNYASKSDNDTPSAFRTAFKYYRSLQPSAIGMPGVIDVDDCTPICTLSSIDENILTSVGLKPPRDWRVSTFDARPGLLLIRSAFIDSNAQLGWIARCICDYPDSPNNVTNLDAHSPQKVANINRDRRLLSKLRWTTIGAHYNWSTKVYPDRRDPLPSELSTLAELVARALGYTDFRPQTAIVNYYASRSTLSGHVDRSERDHSRPLISFSFGQPAVYLSGGMSVDEVPIAMYLRSGDILVMADEQRLVYHAVPRIIVTGTFDGADRELFDSTVIDYAMHNRVNITVRQIE